MARPRADRGRHRRHAGHASRSERWVRRRRARLERLVASRIIRRGLLPPGLYWTSVRAVELWCESTWRLLSGRLLSGQCFQGQCFSDECISRQYPATDRSGVDDRCFSRHVGPSRVGVRQRGDSRRAGGSSPRGSAIVRAYSSIGQSPRLITGLFLVRTQVGPLALFLRSRGAPFRSELLRDRAPRNSRGESSRSGGGGASGESARNSLRSNSLRSNSLRLAAMRRPTSL